LFAAAFEFCFPAGRFLAEAAGAVVVGLEVRVRGIFANVNFAWHHGFPEKKWHRTRRASMTDRAVLLAVKAMGGTGAAGATGSAPMDSKTAPPTPLTGAAQGLPSTATIVHAAKHPMTRHITTFLVVLIILVALNPPFVQETVERKHAMEAVPCSIPRAVMGAFVVTLLVASAPFIIQHRESFVTAWARVAGWFSKD
jgi:hypothetical protein